MKLSKIILTGVLATTLVGTSFAANTVNDTTTLAVVNDENAPKEIKVTELPKPVQEALNDEAYAGWEAEKAWIVKRDGQEIYQVEVQNGEEKTTLLFDENGAAIG